MAALVRLFGLVLFALLLLWGAPALASPPSSSHDVCGGQWSVVWASEAEVESALSALRQDPSAVVERARANGATVEMPSLWGLEASAARTVADAFGVLGFAVPAGGSSCGQAFALVLAGPEGRRPLALVLGSDHGPPLVYLPAGARGALVVAATKQPGAAASTLDLYHSASCSDAVAIAPAGSSVGVIGAGGPCSLAALGRSFKLHALAAGIQELHQERAGACEGAIRGAVALESGEDPAAAGAIVAVLRARTLQHVAHVPVAAGGTYEVAGLPPDSYVVVASADEHEARANGGASGPTAATPIPLACGEVADGIDIVLPLAPTEEPMAPAPSPWCSAITGTVRDALAPIAGAQVLALRSSDGVLIASAFTDAGGGYGLLFREAGSYIVVAARAGYTTEYYPGTSLPSEAAAVELACWQPQQGIDFALEAGFAVSGEVRLDDGGSAIAAHARVAVLDAQTGALFALELAGPGGQYRVDGLPPGRYLVAATADGYEARVFPDETSPAGAVPVELDQALGDATVDFDLPPTDGCGAIEGTVRSDAGVPLGGVLLVAIRESDGAAVASTLTELDGRYRLRAAAEPHVVVALGAGYATEYHADAYVRAEATPVDVRCAQTATGVDFSLAQGFAIAGEVRLGDGSSAFAAQARVAVLDAQTGALFALEPVEPDGSYRVGGLPAGSYRVAATAEGCEARVWPDATSFATGVPVVLGDALGGDAVIDFDLPVTSACGEVRGTVVLADGGDPAASQAFVAALRASDGTLVSLARVASDGSYRFEALAPDRYVIGAQATGYAPSFYASATTFAAATPLTVGCNAPLTNVDLVLPAVP